MEDPCWAKVSPLARDLVRKLLNTDQKARLSAEQILGHNWFMGDGEVVSRARKVMGFEDVKESVQQEERDLVELKVERGKKRRENEDMEVDGSRTMRRKARDKRKTQQGI